MRWFLFIIWCAAVGATSYFLFLARPALNTKQQTIAVIQKSQGSIQTRGAVSPVWLDAQQLHRLAAGDYVASGPGSSALVTFQSGSRLELSENALILISDESESDDTVVTLLRGQVTGVVDPTTRNPRRTTIRTRDQAINLTPNTGVVTLIKEAEKPTQLIQQGTKLAATAAETPEPTPEPESVLPRLAGEFPTDYWLDGSASDSNLSQRFIEIKLLPPTESNPSITTWQPFVEIAGSKNDSDRVEGDSGLIGPQTIRIPISVIHQNARWRMIGGLRAQAATLKLGALAKSHGRLQVFAAPSGEDLVIHYLRTKSPSPLVVSVDQVQPKMSGSSVLIVQGRAPRKVSISIQDGRDLEKLVPLLRGARNFAVAATAFPVEPRGTFLASRRGLIAQLQPASLQRHSVFEIQSLLAADLTFSGRAGAFLGYANGTKNGSSQPWAQLPEEVAVIYAAEGGRVFPINTRFLNSEKKTARFIERLDAALFSEKVTLIGRAR